MILLNVNHHRSLPDPSDVDGSSIEFTGFSQDTSHYAEKNTGNDNYHNSENHKRNYELFIFNPNTLDQKGWEKLGFSKKQTAAIIKYRSNYGPFEKASDLQKIYVISDEKYIEIEPFIVFPDSVPVESDIHETIEINSATQEQLESINGIGPTFAKRTIKYREILGGYASKEQFSEIYGITDDALTALKNNVNIDPDKIKKININLTPKDELKKHPYLNDWSVIAEILSQRDRAKLENLNFLVEKTILSEQELNELLPYISF